MGEGKTIFEEVKEQIKYAFDTSQAPQGGNPLDTSENCPIIALNRFHIPNKKFWNNTPPIGIANPYKASAAVRFSIRVHFRDDFAYIDFGCPWSEIMTEEIDEEVSIEDVDTELIPHFKLLKCHFISKDDAITILEALGLEVTNWDKNFPTTEDAQEVLELTDEDGSIIAL